MKAFAMQVWEMPSGEFLFWTLALVGASMLVRFVATELQISRMKRMARSGLR